MSNHTWHKWKKKSFSQEIEILFNEIEDKKDKMEMLETKNIVTENIITEKKIAKWMDEGRFNWKG